MKLAPKIALLVETSREYGRGILRGVIRYQQEHEPWSIYFKPHGLGESPPPWLNSWRGDGILARINDRRMARALSSTSVPIVDLRNALPDLNLPTVAISNRTVVRLAVDHFLEQGFRRFAFCGTPRGENRNQDDRCALFEGQVKDKGFHCHTYEHPEAPFRSWDSEQRHITRWLKSLPTPIAIMTCHDDRGQQVIDASLRAALAVPDEVAILGVDNDPFLCNLSTPQLSSIDVYPERIGYEAAALLHRLMRGGSPPTKPLLFDPRGLVVRRSTDVTVVSDPHVAEVARLIRDNAVKPVSIEQLLSDIPVSRSALFRRFKEHLGRSPKKELSRVRMERAKALLTNSSLSVEEVARQTFQTDSKHFISVFRKATGMTPLVYRRQRSYHQLSDSILSAAGIPS